MNRYKAMYERTVRPNVASTFPKHVFLRSPNFNQTIHEVTGPREDCLKTTMVHLTERFTGKEVFLVGTLNQSTMLAKRTEKLIHEVEPDAVMVMVNDLWRDKAKMVKFVDSQEEFENYKTYFKGFDNVRWREFYNNSRKWIFLTRLYLYGAAFRMHFRLGSIATFMEPGVEYKFALEAADRVGAQVEFLGPEMN